MLSSLCGQFEEKLNSVKATISDVTDGLDLNVQFVKEEIQIRIESIKNELDKTEKELNKELDKIKSNAFNNMLGDHPFNENEFDKELGELKEIVKDRLDVNEEVQMKYEGKVRELNDLMNSLNANKMPIIEFHESALFIDKNLIGEIGYLSGDVDKEIIKRVQSGKYETFNCGSSTPYDFCLLPNNNILICNYNNYNLLLFDANTERLSETIETVNNQKFGIIAVDTNKRNEIYLSNFRFHRIIKTDLDFNLLAFFGNGPGSASNQVTNPTGLCYYNNSIYVCDRSNKRIQKLDSNSLKHQASYQLNIQPWYIKALNNIACVRAFGETAIYFYELNSFKQIKKYDGHNGTIGASNAYFYEYYSNRKILYVYDKEANLYKQIENVDFRLGSFSDWGSIVVEKSKIILCSFDFSYLSIV